MLCNPLLNIIDNSVDVDIYLNSSINTSMPNHKSIESYVILLHECTIIMSIECKAVVIFIHLYVLKETVNAEFTCNNLDTT